MNKLPKPDLNEFFIRGIPARTAVLALEHWEELDEGDLRTLKFLPARTWDEIRHELFEQSLRLKSMN
jgi:hypothetical protein